MQQLEDIQERVAATREAMQKAKHQHQLEMLKRDNVPSSLAHTFIYICLLEQAVVEKPVDNTLMPTVCPNRNLVE